MPVVVSDSAVTSSDSHFGSRDGPARRHTHEHLSHHSSPEPANSGIERNISSQSSSRNSHSKPATGQMDRFKNYVDTNKS